MHVRLVEACELKNVFFHSIYASDSAQITPQLLLVCMPYNKVHIRHSSLKTYKTQIFEKSFFTISLISEVEKMVISYLQMQLIIILSNETRFKKSKLEICGAQNE